MKLHNPNVAAVTSKKHNYTAFRLLTMLSVHRPPCPSCVLHLPHAFQMVSQNCTVSHTHKHAQGCAHAVSHPPTHPHILTPTHPPTSTVMITLPLTPTDLQHHTQKQRWKRLLMQLTKYITVPQSDEYLFLPETIKLHHLIVYGSLVLHRYGNQVIYGGVMSHS